MPKLGQVPAGGVVKAPPAAPAGPAPSRTPIPHNPADHINFLNADGTRSRICICPCDSCWPSSGTLCADWS